MYIVFTDTLKADRDRRLGSRAVRFVVDLRSVLHDISVLSNLFILQPDSHHALTSHISLSTRTVFSLFLTTSMKAQASGHHGTASYFFRHLVADMQET